MVGLHHRVALAVLVALAAFLPSTAGAESDPNRRLPVAEPGVEGSIVRLYEAFFQRGPDGAGLDHWAGRYRDGLPLASVADAFARSSEFAATYGSLTDAEFVDLVYRNVLGRDPDPEGRAHWQRQLAAGSSRGSVMLALSESGEHVARTSTPAPTQPRRLLASSAFEHRIARIYLGFLGRWPDAAGFDHWVLRALRGTPITALTDAILATPELQARYGGTTDEQFVRRLYTDVLGRAADEPGVASWLDALRRGATRGSVATAFTQSPEMVARTRTAPPRAPTTGMRLLAVGDSVMLGARSNILAIGGGWTISVDTRGCRNPTIRGDGCGATNIPSGVDALRLARAEGRMGDVVVISLGNNGPMSTEQFEAVMAEVADVPRVIWFNQHEPRSYEGPNNRVIAAGVARHPNAELIDWHSLGNANPGWFSSDGIHLSGAGRQAMADLIAARLRG
jgi:hypothetical protein